ncbi:MAG: hypothetical protein GX230_03270 [Lentisphaerae bacterium]|nr:hypothetical protein [Lentisphaerota bacterium]
MAHLWHNVAAAQTEITAIDFETTGSVSGWPVEPWQVGMVSLINGRVVAATATCHWIQIDPNRPFNRHAPGRHQQVREQLAVAPAFVDVWATVAPTRLLHKPLVAHNIGTERTLLRKVAPLHRHGPWIDTLTLTRHAWPELTGYSLENIIYELSLTHRLQEVSPLGQPHDAGHDACACAVLLEHLLAQPAWQGVTIATLAEAGKSQ